MPELHSKAEELSDRLDPELSTNSECQIFDIDEITLDAYDFIPEEISWTTMRGNFPEVAGYVKNEEFDSPHVNGDIVISLALCKELQKFLSDVQQAVDRYSDEFNDAMEQYNNIRMHNTGLPQILSQERYNELLKKEAALQLVKNALRV